MGFFGDKNPKLPNYVTFDLDDLLSDPEWDYRLSEAGIDLKRCEIVLRLAAPTVKMRGIPQSPEPAILIGQGKTLALALPMERQVKVVTREKQQARLQTSRSGWLQVIFGGGAAAEGLLFASREDNLRPGTPEGEAFVKAMSAFLKEQLRLQQITGTPQSLAADGVTIEPPTSPSNDPFCATSSAPVQLLPTPSGDPGDALRLNMVKSVQTALAGLKDKYQQCFEKAQDAEGAFGMANADYVNGVRQHELSKESFRRAAIQEERQLVILLGELRQATAFAQRQWKDLIFLLPGSQGPGSQGTSRSSVPGVCRVP